MNQVPVSVYAGKFCQGRKASFKSEGKGRQRSGRVWTIWRIVKKVLFTPLGSGDSIRQKKTHRRLLEEKSDQRKMLDNDEVQEGSLCQDSSWQYSVDSDNYNQNHHPYYQEYHQIYHQEPDQLYHMSQLEQLWSQLSPTTLDLIPADLDRTFQEPHQSTDYYSRYPTNTM